MFLGTPAMASLVICFYSIESYFACMFVARHAVVFLLWCLGMIFAMKHTRRLSIRGAYSHDMTVDVRWLQIRVIAVTVFHVPSATIERQVMPVRIAGYRILPVAKIA